MIKIADISGTPLYFLKDTRDFLLSCRDKAPDNIRIGLNYNIIIDTALILEAESEDLLHNVINQYERLYIKYYQPDLSEADKAMADNAKKLLSSAFPRLKDYSSKGTGMKHYIDTFKMLIPESDLTSLKTYDEAIQVLYQ